MSFQRRDNTVPAPFLVKATGVFDGNDGNWSTFDLKVGNPTQELRVLVSTLGEVSWLPAAAGCASTNNANCGNLRGVDPSAAGSSLKGYDESLSSTANALGTYQLPLNADITMTAAFGSDYTLNVTIDQDNFYIQSASGSDSQLTANKTDFAEVSSATLFVGALGLGFGNVSDVNINSDSTTLMQSLVDSGAIPSKSWGYTAGAYYNNGGYAGNLVLGGYDSTRFQSGLMDFKMPPSTDQSFLRVTLSSFQIDSWSSAQGPIQVILDSTLPYLYLPDDMCNDLAQHLGLQYDNSTDLYLINNTQRASNLKSMQNIKMVLTDTTDGNTLSTITLPYAAFDLNASWPIYTGDTAYFPIRKAQGTNYILGRTFFQEAYVVANYEQRNFSVVQATFSDPPPQPSLVTIFSSNYTPQSKHKSSGISGGAIAGIVIGVVGAFALAGLAWFLLTRRRRQQRRNQIQRQKLEDDELARRREHTFSTVGTLNTDDGTVVSHEMDALSPVGEAARPTHQRHISELSSDSEISTKGQKPITDPIYELEATQGAPDSLGWQENARRVNEEVSPTSPSSNPPSAL